MSARHMGSALLLASLLVVSCGADSPDGEVNAGTVDDTTTSTTTAEVPTSTEPDVTVLDGGIDPMDDADRSDKQGGEEIGPAAYLTDVRIGRHEGFDRVVFEFRGELPAWWVSTDSGELLGDPTGEPLEIGGQHRLDVRVSPASRVEFTDEDPGYIEIYTGPDRVPGTAATVTEAVLVGDFEGNLLWAIGLRDAVDFRVLTLENPTRLVVDVGNH